MRIKKVRIKKPKTVSVKKPSLQSMMYGKPEGTQMARARKSGIKNLKMMGFGKVV